VLVRLSGTEALVRVMVEGAAEEQVNDLAGRIALAVELAVGSADAGGAQAVTAGRHGA
jgi:phosphomannomutase